MGDTSVIDPHSEQIGLATSTSVNGPYRKYRNNPILKFNDDLNAWDSQLIADPWIYKFTDGYYYLGYAGGGAGGQGGGQYEWKTGIARSTDLYGTCRLIIGPLK